jgi:dTDP-4-amino-4,6-dideoxygalactose transaminase
MTEGALSALRWLPGGAQARAGLRQLAALDGRNQQRREVGAALLEALTARGVPGLPAPADAGGDHVYVSFALRHPDRARFGGALRRAGVDFSPGYMSPCSAIPELGGWRGRCPEAETVARHIVHLPLYPGLSAKDVERIAAGVAAAHQATEGA